MNPVGREPQDMESAWEEAAEYGVDMSLIEISLAQTPTERARAHDRALAEAERLRSAIETLRNDRSTRASDTPDPGQS